MNTAQESIEALPEWMTDRNQPVDNSEVVPAKPKGRHLWQKGQSGNPSGMNKGHSHKLSKSVYRDLALVWQQKGIAAVHWAADNDPATFLRVIASVMPRDIKMEHTLRDLRIVEFVGVQPAIEAEPEPE